MAKAKRKYPEHDTQVRRINARLDTIRNTLGAKSQLYMNARAMIEKATKKTQVADKRVKPVQKIGRNRETLNRSEKVLYTKETLDKIESWLNENNLRKEKKRLQRILKEYMGAKGESVPKSKPLSKNKKKRKKQVRTSQVALKEIASKDSYLEERKDKALEYCYDVIDLARRYPTDLDLQYTADQCDELLEKHWRDSGYKSIGEVLYFVERVEAIENETPYTDKRPQDIGERAGFEYHNPDDEIPFPW